ncbi:hypothetical protein RhiirA4_486680 [Rhizophagus irregularis]|uniref:Uncharacterized protein n=1 Tax=Rhizophagus irregularis TaxID=588596 RepID=A0A2I1HRX2_9GLOM|nr:hypothetical protein RhiirA4_486680 [Rhizophagus irregularis]
MPLRRFEFHKKYLMDDDNNNQKSGADVNSFDNDQISIDEDLKLIILLIKTNDVNLSHHVIEIAIAKNDNNNQKSGANVNLFDNNQISIDKDLEIDFPLNFDYDND